jgi:hypothetical protein
LIVCWVTTNWNTFKEAFLLNFADPIKKEKAIRELGKLTQTRAHNHMPPSSGFSPKRYPGIELQWSINSRKD